MDLYRETLGIYATDLFTQESETIIQNHNKKDPLFLFLSHLAPHAPLQAPQDTIDKFSYIQDVNRRKYAAMVNKFMAIMEFSIEIKYKFCLKVSILDDGVGRVVKALEEKKMLDNSVILFFADNGAPITIEHKNAGSNNPFRGVSIQSHKHYPSSSFSIRKLRFGSYVICYGLQLNNFFVKSD